jgi:1-acyl-sn-glycerol-3-phosphate acyltransferase
LNRPARARRLAARWLVKRALELRVEGLEHVPASGPVLVVARHYHHLYDAAAILACLSREVHIVVALDWLAGGMRLRIMRWLTAAARWPTVWRPGAAWHFNREAYASTLQLLRERRVLLIFPEAYPNVDPSGSHKSDPDEFMPFEAGFLVLAERAGLHVPLVPAGVYYGSRGTMWLRFGRPIYHSAAERRLRRVTLGVIEAEVRRLSLPPTN